MYQDSGTDNTLAFPWFQRLLLPPALAVKLTLLGFAIGLTPLLLAMPNLIGQPILGAMAAFIALCLPGLFVSLLLFKPGSLCLLERAPVAFVFSLALAGALGLMAFQVHVSPWTFYWSLAALSALLGLATMARTAHGKVELAAISWKRYELPLLVLLVMALVVLFRLELTAKANADNWTYLSYVQEYAGAKWLAYVDPMSGGTRPSDPRVWFNIWLLDQAFIGKASGVALVALVETCLPAILSLVSMLAMFMVGKEVIGSSVGGALAALFQLTYFASTMLVSDYPGSQFFFRMSQDKTIATLIILPVGVAFMLRYLKTGHKAYLLAHGLVALALATTHPTISVFYPVILALFGTVHLLMQRDRVSMMRLIVLFLVLLPCLIVPLIQKVSTSPEVSYVSYSLSDNVVEPGMAEMRMSRLLPLSSDGRIYILHPRLFTQPMTLMALAMVPIIGILWRRDVGARLLVGLGVGVPFLLYNPAITPILGRLITPWQIWKLAAVFPAGVIVAYVVCRVVALAGKTIPASRCGLVAAAVPVVLVMTAAASLAWPSFADKPEWFRYGDEMRLDAPDTKELLLSLGSYAPPGSLVLAVPKISQIIPAFYRDIEVLTPYDNYSQPREDAPATDPMVKRRADAKKFYDGKLSPDGIRRMLAEYGIEFIIAPKGSKAGKRLDEMGPTVRLVRAFGDHLLYSVDGVTLVAP